MANSDYSAPLDQVTFRCKCGRTFSAAPSRVFDCPDRDWHPWGYAAACPDCGADAAPPGWWLALLKAWQFSTGPKSDAGKAASAANLAGHPTPEEAQRTRFNALKHGLSARVATYFPAKPGKYGQCANCDVDWAFCESQPCCTRQTALFMRFAAAFERRDPKMLADLFADQQAGLFAIVQHLMATVIADGGVVRTPRCHVDKDGEVTLVEYYDEAGKKHQVFDIAAHPLLRPLAEFITRANLNMADMGMAGRVVADEEEAMGRLKVEQADKALETEHRERQVKALENLAGVIQRAQAAKAGDPVLLEHQEQSGATQ